MLDFVKRTNMNERSCTSGSWRSRKPSQHRPDSMVRFLKNEILRFHYAARLLVATQERPMRHMEPG